MRAEVAWIPMSDGIRLAVTLYLPDQGSGPWPAVLEYLPYRKDDWTLHRDQKMYPYLTDRGYVGARVDIRGTGRSEGRLPEGEYSEQEQADGIEVIAWLASRPWSNGAVGMWGISWGGFNSIQLAIRRPPALRAIIAVDASDDLFHDDIHYIDGIWHLDEYEVGIDLWNALTPAPDFPVDEEILRLRFDSEPWLLAWLRHQRDGWYWRRASLAPGHDRLGVPALLVGGWLDGYRDSVARMLADSRGPIRAIVGPWNHAWPHDATPGPEVEWRREAVRWWDHWLKGRDSGLLEEPRLAVYLRSWHPPDPSLEVVPGTWRWEDWPIAGAGERVLHLAPDGSLGTKRAEREAVHRLAYRPSAGAEAGPWWGELADDQAPLDETCLVYQTEPLRESVAIIGIPITVLDTAVDAALAHWFVRLSDVSPDGRVTLVTGGGLNGAHRGSADRPEPLVQGEVQRLEIPLRFTSWVFPENHRIRIAVSNHLWPMLWPTPYPMTMSLHLGGPRDSHLRLPVVPLHGRAAPRFDPPELTPDPQGVGSMNELLPVAWEVRRGPASAVATWRGRSSSWFPWGRMDSSERLAFEVSDAEPARAAARGEGEVHVALAGRTVTWRTQLNLGSDAEAFHYRFRRILSEDRRVIRDRRWEESVPRDGQ